MAGFIVISAAWYGIELFRLDGVEEGRFQGNSA